VAGADHHAASGERQGIGVGERRSQQREQEEQSDESGVVNGPVVSKANDGASSGWVGKRRGLRRRQAEVDATRATFPAHGYEVDLRWLKAGLAGGARLKRQVGESR
jgi:hypothetical protein